MRDKTLEDIEPWERERGPDIEPWKLDVVQQVKKEKRKWWFAHRRGQIIVGVISGALVGLTVAGIPLVWMP